MGEGDCRNGGLYRVHERAFSGTESKRELSLTWGQNQQKQYGFTL